MTQTQDDSTKFVPVLSSLESEMHQYHGKYRYLCLVGRQMVWTHAPIGLVLKEFG